MPDTVATSSRVKVPPDDRGHLRHRLGRAEPVEPGQ